MDYVQQPDGAPGWKTVASSPSRQGAQSRSNYLREARKAHNRGLTERHARALSRSALLREGGLDACGRAEDDLEGLELERATLRMRS